MCDSVRLLYLLTYRVRTGWSGHSGRIPSLLKLQLERTYIKNTVQRYAEELLCRYIRQAAESAAELAARGAGG